LNRDRLFGLTFAAFGMMATLAQVWVLPWPIRLAVVVGTVVSALVAWRFSEGRDIMNTPSPR
jgi:membrane protein implicated in regulation of membrane protease activity